ncbi:MAG: glycine zipper 2TM domain-containing protein [Chloroflexota bacterium]
MPAPRPGLAGSWDRFMGPGATPVENAGTVVGAVLGGIIGSLLPHRGRERVLGAVAGFDVLGGVWANETPAAKRWYHREGVGRFASTQFAAVHVYPFLVEAVTGRRAWRRAAVQWAGPVIASAIVEATPPASQERVATAASALAGAAGAVLAPAGFRWLPPLLAVKLIHAHAAADGPLVRALAPDRVPAG